MSEVQAHLIRTKTSHADGNWIQIPFMFSIWCQFCPICVCRILLLQILECFIAILQHTAV